MIIAAGKESGTHRGTIGRESVKKQAGELGFEPRLTESESVVLPLHHSPILRPYHKQKLAGPAEKLVSNRRANLLPLYAITVRRAPKQVNTDGPVGPFASIVTPRYSEGSS